MDSQLIEGVHQELVPCSHRSLVEGCLGRTMTKAGEGRCSTVQNGKLSSNKHSLEFQLSVIPMVVSALPTPPEGLLDLHDLFFTQG